MNSTRHVLIAAALLALTGLSVATYVFAGHSLGYELFCPFATGGDTVQNSAYAVLFGIPVSLLGVLGPLRTCGPTSLRRRLSSYLTPMLLCSRLRARDARLVDGCGAGRRDDGDETPMACRRRSPRKIWSISADRSPPPPSRSLRLECSRRSVRL
jgi:hypothetical protein